MGIQKSVFWDDLAKDLKNPARLAAFIKESRELEILHTIKNTEKFTAVGHPLEDRFIWLSEIKDGRLDGEGKRISNTALKIASNISLIITDSKEFGIPNLFPTEEGGISIEWQDLAKTVFYFIEISFLGKVFFDSAQNLPNSLEGIFFGDKVY